MPVCLLLTNERCLFYIISALVAAWAKRHRRTEDKMSLESSSWATYIACKHFQSAPQAFKLNSHFAGRHGFHLFPAIDDQSRRRFACQCSIIAWWGGCEPGPCFKLGMFVLWHLRLQMLNRKLYYARNDRIHVNVSTTCIVFALFLSSVGLSFS